MIPAPQKKLTLISFHWYLWQFDFLWNNRQFNDRERTILAVKAAEGKRLMYRPPITQ
jgi:hypothetical protein